ncbi:hypothetical protein ACQP2F_36070 [Actinoplanes sp. CA-030573]|uniref:hypothetical protein n=1 Tax=Actinoplanes sp. CA-030573 TaxID=3239898 RepID=UPI003D8A38CA
MSGITLEGLMHADTAGLWAAAADWDRLVEQIDDTVEDLVRGTRDLPHHWLGDGSRAALDRNHELQLEIGNAHLYCGQIAAAIRRFAEDLDQCRRMLRAVVAEAEGDGMRIDLAGGLITAGLESAGAVDAYVAQIDQILARADDADLRAREAIERNVLREEDRPEGELPELYTDFLVLETAPSFKAATWHEMHPLNRDRLIEEHPELVGPAVGLPSDARDRANRLLLRRAKADLLARRDRLDAVRDGAAGRATMNVDAGLAAIAAVERRPGRLLSYPPAVLAEGDPAWDDYVPPVERRK